MKMIAKIFLIIFIAFLATPTIVTVIEKSSDISVFYSMSEEEDFQKETKTFLSLKHFFGLNMPLKLTSNAIFSENLAMYGKIVSPIFLPPPNQL
jgi:hypothetical protein